MCSSIFLNWIPGRQKDIYSITFDPFREHQDKQHGDTLLWYGTLFDLLSLCSPSSTFPSAKNRKRAANSFTSAALSSFLSRHVHFLSLKWKVFTTSFPFSLVHFLPLSFGPFCLVPLPPSWYPGFHLLFSQHFSPLMEVLCIEKGKTAPEKTFRKTETWMFWHSLDATHF